MNKPVFLIKIEGESISCLGSQLIDILHTLKPYLGRFSWYAADVKINGEQPFKLGLEGFNSHNIGTLSNLIDLCKQVDQFLSGVFYQVDDSKNPSLEELSTEDAEFRSIPNAVLEIRAFDTTYFEVYTSNVSMVQALKSRYSAEVFQSKIGDNVIHLKIPSLIMIDIEGKYKELKGSYNSLNTARLGKATKLSNSADNLTK